MASLVRGQSGQTTVEYLLLMGIAALTAYIVVSVPMARFTRLMLATIQGSIRNVVQNGDMAPGEVIAPGQGGHPSDPARMKALHQ